MVEYSYDGIFPIKGIGIDGIRISRISKIKPCIKDRLARRILSENEYRLYCSSKSQDKTLAGYFCAKEAVAKALGTGMRGVAFCDIIINKDSLGRPYITLSERGNKLAESLNIKQIKISLTHDGDNVNAVAITA